MKNESRSSKIRGIFKKKEVWKKTKMKKEEEEVEKENTPRLEIIRKDAENNTMLTVVENIISHYIDANEAETDEVTCPQTPDYNSRLKSQL